MSNVAFIGVGRMGLPMARHVAKHLEGNGTLRTFDVAEPAIAAARDVGLTVCDSLSETVAGADIVVLMLPGSRYVEDVLRHDAVLSALPIGALVIDMSSSEPMSTRELAAELSARGLRMIDAPVSGGVAGAVAATLTIMVGGESAAIDDAEGLLACMGRVVRTGDIGSGHALKALNNMLSATSLLVSSEALEIGRRFGLDDEVMLAVLNTSTGKSWSTEFKLPKYVVPGVYNSGFAMSLMVKDMNIAASLARQLGLPSLLGEESLRLWTQAARELGPEADHTDIGRFAATPHLAD